MFYVFQWVFCFHLIFYEAKAKIWIKVTNKYSMDCILNYQEAITLTF